MEATTNTARHKRQDKYNRFSCQMKVVLEAFSERPKTMLEVSIETGTLRANICRYIATWKHQNKIHLVKFGLCPISKHRAGFYSSLNQKTKGK